MSSWNVKAHNLRAHQARVLADVLLSLDPDDPTTLDKRHIASPAGSERALRGIPVVGAQGVGGTITGTNPLQALIAKQPNE